MKKGTIILLAVLGVFILGGVSMCSSVVGVWNTLNSNYQGVQAGKSHYGAALDIVPEKIKGVWQLSDQYLDHESDTFKMVAAARSGLLQSIDGFKKAEQGGASDADMLKNGQGVMDMFNKFKDASLAVNVQIEAYPQLRGAETTKTAMRAVEEGVNEIKTALDDWIASIKVYNEYRGSAWPSILGGFMAKFPVEIPYYEAERTKLNIDELNPKSNK